MRSITAATSGQIRFRVGEDRRSDQREADRNQQGNRGCVTQALSYSGKQHVARDLPVPPNGMSACVNRFCRGSYHSDVRQPRGSTIKLTGSFQTARIYAHQASEKSGSGKFHRNPSRQTRFAQVIAGSAIPAKVPAREPCNGRSCRACRHARPEPGDRSDHRNISGATGLQC